MTKITQKLRSAIVGIVHARAFRSISNIRMNMIAASPITSKELGEIGPLLQALLLVDRQTRSRVQEYGVNIVPTDFYSNVPSIKEIDASYEYEDTNPPYLLESVFRDEFLLEVLSKLSDFASEFDPPTEGNEENCVSFFWGNDQFSYSDAMSYYCFIRLTKPRRILEIGSGFSTLVALEAVRRNGFGRIVCVEPFPRPFLEKNRDIEVRKQKAQQLSASDVNALLDDGDVLFIDSTHTVKTGSDCLHLYLRVLPQLKKRVLVHVHDVFLPFGLPKDWLSERQIYWTEQYLVLALLIGNTKAKVMYGSTYHHFKNRSKLDEFMLGRFPSGGASFWFEYDGR
jgi:hypothetical protein